MPVICPTVTAKTPDEYKRQARTAMDIAKRIHIDLADGIFAPVRLISPGKIRLPSSVRVDVHLMYKKPEAQLNRLIELEPDLVILHAESEGNFVEMADRLHESGIKVGVALLPKTAPTVIEPALELIDHVLIFSGDLGHFGGTANLGLLKKAEYLKQRKPSLEIGWDGGINSTNVKRLVEGGVSVLNVGGYIQKADNPRAHFDSLDGLIR